MGLSMAFRGVGECNAWRGLISRGADGELGAVDEAGLQAHLSACAGCAAVVRVDAELRLMLRRDPLPLTEVRLPSGREIARSVLEAEPAAVRRPGRRAWGWAGAVAAAAAVAIIGSRSPAPRQRVIQAAPPAASQPVPGFWIVDDERTGRDVIVGPSVSFAGTQ